MALVASVILASIVGGIAGLYFLRIEREEARRRHEQRPSAREAETSAVIRHAHT